MKSTKSLFALAWAVLLIVVVPSSLAQRERPPLPTPTHANVSYGEHPNQGIDFWQAEVGNNGPLVIFIHGGGFSGGSKKSIGAAKVNAYLEKGIHVASVEYRFLKHAKLPAAHEDAVRAIQFIRSKARDWKIDKKKIGAFGGSAGAQLVAYLAWHDDMADPKSDDPIARESTRVAAVAPLNGQATMDLNWWIENIPGYDAPHRKIEEYTDLSGIALKALTKEMSVINHISSDDPPTFMSYGMKPDDQIPEDEKRASGWKVHHVYFGIAMEEKLRNAGVEATLNYPVLETRYKNEVEFFIDQLLWEGGQEKYKNYEAHTFKGSSGESIHYQLLKPQNYNPKKKYPLVVFLHGSGGRGPANIRNVVDATVGAQIASNEVYGKHDAFYLVPQCPGPNTWAKAEWMDARPNARPSVQDTLYELIDSTIAGNNIDTRRLYLTGLSMGGFGTFSTVALRPNFWAAAVPVCGGWNASDADVFKDTPMQLFHGDEDKAVDVKYSRDMFAAIQAAGGDIEYTEYPGVGHNSWLKAYWDQDMWKWMFKQKR
jgi:predicted peptidase